LQHVFPLLRLARLKLTRLHGGMVNNGKRCNRISATGQPKTRALNRQRGVGIQRDRNRMQGMVMPTVRNQVSNAFHIRHSTRYGERGVGNVAKIVLRIDDKELIARFHEAS
jgi:hypothetical protein